MAFVPYGKRDSYLLTAIPKPLREALRSEVEERNTSAANVIGGILAHRYKVEFEESKRQLRSDYIGGVSLGLRLPPAVMKAVRKEADKLKLAIRSVILIAIAEHFELEPPMVTKADPARRRGRPRHGRPKGRKGARR